MSAYLNIVAAHLDFSSSSSSYPSYSSSSSLAPHIFFFFPTILAPQPLFYIVVTFRCFIVFYLLLFDPIIWRRLPYTPIYSCMVLLDRLLISLFIAPLKQTCTF